MSAPHARCGKGKAGKGCGRRILVGVLGNGGLVPLDLSAPVYEITGRNEDGTMRVRKVPEVDLGMVVPGPGGIQIMQRYLVAHYATCPRANLPSRSPAKKAA